MGANQDRWDAMFEERDAELAAEHLAGDHAEPEPDCSACYREQRERLREGDPAFNGAFDKW